jgi:hypothetical protein
MSALGHVKTSTDRQPVGRSCARRAGVDGVKRQVFGVRPGARNRSRSVFRRVFHGQRSKPSMRAVLDARSDGQHAQHFTANQRDSGFRTKYTPRQRAHAFLDTLDRLVELVLFPTRCSFLRIGSSRTDLAQSNATTRATGDEAIFSNVEQCLNGPAAR